jgi:hypothetical protein
MAIKGKNKSKSRPGGARRRPVGGARPAPALTRSAPWYKTMGGQLTAIFVVLAIIGLVMWRVSVSSSESSKLEARQDVLVEYTGEVENYVDKIQQTVRQMMGAPFNTANPEALAGLEESSAAWKEELEANGALIQALKPPDELTEINVVLQQSFLMYGSAAKIYALIPDEDQNETIQALIDRATEVREEAGVVMSSAIRLLDQARTDAELRASGIQVPAHQAPILPTPAPTDQAEDGSSKKKNNDG